MKKSSEQINQVAFGSLPIPANDNDPFDPTTPGGVGAMRPDRVLFVEIDAITRECLESIAQKTLDHADGWPVLPREQRQVALRARKQMRRLTPDLINDLLKVRWGVVDAIYVTGLPEAELTARVLMLSMSLSIGEAFNFEAQNGGELIMKLTPKVGAGANNNATPDEFRMHTDDAAIPRECRVHHICLLGRKHPKGVHTHFAPLSWALARMAQENASKATRALAMLSEKRFQFAFPISLGAGPDVWTPPRSIVSVGPDGRLEIAFPSYNTRTVDPADIEGNEAAEWLLSSLDAVKLSIEVEPGTFFGFCNLRGTHSRDRIGAGDREIWRTYGIDTLDGLRRLTGEAGPIFPIAPFVELTANDN